MTQISESSSYQKAYNKCTRKNLNFFNNWYLAKALNINIFRPYEYKGYKNYKHAYQNQYSLEYLSACLTSKIVVKMPLRVSALNYKAAYNHPTYECSSEGCLKGSVV